MVLDRLPMSFYLHVWGKESVSEVKYIFDDAVVIYPVLEYQSKCRSSVSEIKLESTCVLRGPAEPVYQ